MDAMIYPARFISQEDAMNNPVLNINRPGGFIITDRALVLCRFRPGAKILDLGCGSGGTVEYLRKDHALDAYGLDPDPALLPKQNNFILAHAENIPLPPASMDGVLMECSFSMMEDQQTVLHECFRLLKPCGMLIVSDTYARGEPSNLNGCLGRIDRKETIIAIIEDHGFTLEHFEDFSRQLQSYWGQLIFEKGAKSFYSDLGTDPEAMKRIQCGYYLLVAVKMEL